MPECRSKCWNPILQLNQWQLRNAQEVIGVVSPGSSGHRNVFVLPVWDFISDRPSAGPLLPAKGYHADHRSRAVTV